jgi:excisionase family DNA binding protein
MGTHEADRATLTVEEAAARLGISRTLAYELARAGRLPVPVLRLGRRVVISRLACWPQRASRTGRPAMRPPSPLPLAARQAAWDRLWRILLAPPAPSSIADDDSALRRTDEPTPHGRGDRR